MEIKPAGYNNISLGKVASRSEVEAPLVSNKDVSEGDGVALGKLGSTLFQNGKAISFREAQALVGNSSKSELPREEQADFSGFDLSSTMVLGGPDSPCFYKGKVMTTREARELAAREKAEG